MSTEDLIQAARAVIVEARRMRVRAAIAFAVLVAGNGFAIYLAAHNAHNANARLARAVRSTLAEGCERGNELRGALRGVVLSGRPAIDKYFKDGVITREQHDFAVAQQDRALESFAGVDCAKAYPPLR